VSEGVTLEQAREALASRKGAVVRDEFQVASKGDLPTVAAFFKNEYLPWAKAHKRTWDDDEARFRCHIAPAFGDHRLDEVTRGEVERWQSALLDGHAPATVNRVFTLLRFLFNKAIAWGHLKASPCKGVKQLRENNERVRFLTEEELGRLLEAAGQTRNPWLRPLITVAVNTGLRRGELFNLRWADVDLERRILTLQETKDGTTARVPFNDEVLFTLTALPRVAGNPYVFPGNTASGRLDNVGTSWQTALREAGITDFRFHDLRHTFASHLVMAGVDMNTVRELMRHKTLNMTLRYSHLAPEHRQAALAKIGGMFARATGENGAAGGHRGDNAKTAVAPSA